MIEFFGFHKLVFGISKFLQFLVLSLEIGHFRLNFFHKLSGQSILFNLDE